MRIHILGASGSGVTTLGRSLSARIGFPYFDSDEYFWEASDPAFTKRRDPEERNQLILTDTRKHDRWILGGSLLNWNLEIPFDLIVFLYVPHEIRMERLKNRELSRYGEIIRTSETRRQQYEDFMAWARGYDDNSTQGRNLAAHENWLHQQTCIVLELRGNYPVEERIRAVLQQLNEPDKMLTY